jgi:hypothetical protein
MRTFTLKGWDARAFEDHALDLVSGAVVVVTLLALIAWAVF